ncbi:MAG: flippase-like domain-containing protein [Cyanobacteria bacterium]|nr:flippase-like domain-containing protein [Cyanobacteriota bacterium]
MKSKIKTIKENKIKKNISLILRIIISIGLFTVLIIINLKNLKSIPDILKNLNIYLTVLGILFYFIGIALEAPRWNTLLSAYKIHIPYTYLFNSVFIGFFYGTLLPTNIGGDAYRGIDLHKTFKVPVHKNIIALYLGRFMGIISGLLLLMISLCFGMYKHLNKSFLIGLLTVLPLVIFLIILTTIPKKFKIDILFNKIKFLKKYSTNVLEFSNALDSYKHKSRVVILSFTCSLLGNLSSLISFYFIGMALKLNITFLAYMFIIPVTWTITNIPITVGGFGVRESTLVLLLKEFGISSESALTFSLIVLIINILLAIFGGIIYILRNLIYKRKK